MDPGFPGCSSWATAPFPQPIDTMNTHFKTRLSRRNLIKTLGTYGAALGSGSIMSSPLLAATTTKKAGKNNQNPWIYAFTIGDVEAWSISDGFLDIRQGLDLMYPESERGKMKQAMEERLESTSSLQMYINILVLRRDREVIVFDAGFGIVDHPDRGWLIEGLDTIGIKREDITAAFLSHTHGDHIAGFIAPDEKPMFPNAAIYITPEERSFWMQKTHDFSRTKRDPKALDRLVKTAQKRLELLSGQIVLSPTGSEMLGGLVTVEEGFGHTPGHAMYRISSADETLLNFTDVAHSDILMFRDPAWVIGWDHDMGQAVETRRRVFKQAAREKTPCFGFHVPWPGLGGIVPRGSKESYDWAPRRIFWG
jgi:glyoxylase-like metal-dependent hydrolase (beta-lactamase superfamily II)